MGSDKNKFLTSKDIYDEIGRNYRYFLNWRHALFAGYLLTLYVLARAYSWLLEYNHTNFAWLVFLSGLLMSLCFWGLEVRVRDLYQACTRAGCKFESAFYRCGIYIELDSAELRNKKITHTRVLNWFFGIISLGMFIMLLCSVCRMLK